MSGQKVRVWTLVSNSSKFACCTQPYLAAGMSSERSRAVAGMQDCFGERRGFQTLGYLRLGKTYFLCFLYAAGPQQKVERRRYRQVSAEWCYMTEQGLLVSGEWQYVIERGRVMSVKEHHLMPVKWW